METETEEFYCDLNGRIACLKHIGNEARTRIAARKDLKVIRTTMTIWEKMTEQEISEFSDLIGSNHTICENCRYTK